MELAEHGILIGEDFIISDTDWCMREEGAWWDHASKEPHPKWKGRGRMALDRFQMRKREGTLNILTGHWTAGEAGTKEYMDDGRRVTTVIKRRASRKFPDRRLMASVTFVIGACDLDAEYAPCWQTMNLALGWAGTHVGRGEVNRRSAGVEIVNAGLDGHLNTRDREETRVHMFGRERDVLLFYPGQIRTWVRLANALAGKCFPGDIEIPRQVPIEYGRDGVMRPYGQRFTRREQRKWKGAMEHYLMDATRKIDAGTMLLSALLDAGWEGVEI